VKNEEEGESSLVLSREISIHAFETMMNMTVPHLLATQRSMKLRIKAIKLVVPFLRTFKTQFPEPELFHAHVSENKFLPNLIEEVTKLFSETEETLKVEATLALRLVICEFVPPSAIRSNKQFYEALQAMRANAVIGLSQKMTEELKRGTEVESESVNFIMKAPQEVLRKALKFSIDETGAGSGVIQEVLKQFNEKMPFLVLNELRLSHNQPTKQAKLK